MNLSEIANTVCLIKSLFNDPKYLKSTQIISQHIVCAFFTGQIMQENRMNLSETAKTVCLLKSILNERMNTKPTQ